MHAVSEGLEKVDVAMEKDRVNNDKDTIHSMHLVHSGCRLISGLIGLNIVLFGVALIAGDAVNPAGFQHQEPEIFVIVLMLLSLLWMLWYLLWVRRQPGHLPHTDHHAGSATVKVVLVLFAVFSLLMCVFRVGYNLLMRECLKSPAKIISPFIQAPFFVLQTYLLWIHSKDCIHRHKVLTRAGLMMTLCADVLLWFSGVTDDSVHIEIELEDQNKDLNTTFSLLPPLQLALGQENGTLCQCSANAICVAFRKGYEILYPFNMEYSLLAGCMLYIMWKNVGRHVTNVHNGLSPKRTMPSFCNREILFGPLLGLLVLTTGVVVFVLYHVWVDQREKRLMAILLFYGFHVGLMPVMALCTLSGILLQRLKEQELERHKNLNSFNEQKMKEQGPDYRPHVQGRNKNPTQSLDVALLVGTAVGQLSLSYLSTVAALALGPNDIIENLDLSYSLFMMVELVLQNIFIIKGLHLHIHAQGSAVPHLVSLTQLQSSFKKKEDEDEKNDFSKQSELEKIEKVDAMKEDELRQKNTPVTSTERGFYNPGQCNRRVIREICAFLVLSNITLWVIPAFGAHPELQNGPGKQFFGFSVWFVLVNLSQPLTVFYRMHSVGALLELVTA